MNQRGIRISLQVAIWLLAYLLPYYLAYGEISGQTVFKNSGDYIHLASTILLIAFSYINYYRLIPHFYLQRKYALYAGWVFASLLIVIWLPNLFETTTVHPPRTGSPPPPFGPPGGEGPPPGIIGRNYNIVLFIISTFLAMSIRQQLQYLETKKEKLDAEMSFLKAQINPHFLFNTLNSIYSLAIQKSDDTPKAIIQLSELMRYILKESDADKVSLDKELSYLDNYISLQRRRLGDTVKIDYVSPKGITQSRIAPLVLMSFIENAFKHGVNPDQDSAISISISLKENQLRLSVVNNKVASINREEILGIGLKNTISRLEHLYPGKHELLITDRDKTYSVDLTMELA